MDSTVWSSTLSSTTTKGFSLADSPPDGPPPGGPGGPGGGGPPMITKIQKNLALYGYIFLFLFGYIGHINSIIIFLRQTLRSVSTSSLFIAVTISDMIYLAVCTYDFLYTGVDLPSVSSQINPALAHALCRFRSFIQAVAMCSSAWILVAISIDRWLRIRYPFRVKQLCTQKRVLCGALFIVICAVALNSHLLLPSFGSLPGATVCGPISSSTYSFFFRRVWGVLFTCLQTIVPTITLLIVTTDTFRRIRKQQQQRERLNQGRRRAFVDRQMLIITLTSIFLFFSTQIPQSLFNILLSPVLMTRLTMIQALQLASILSFVASIDFATTFYVHCLTSGLFRKEFYNVLAYCACNHNQRIGVVTQMIGETTRTQIGLTRMREKRNQQECSIDTINKPNE